MCRLMAFMACGHEPMLVADVVLWPDRSIIKQSYDARERKGDPALPFHLGHGNLNGDGFGIGWFPTEDRRDRDPTPCVFTSITPAWNNENLARLACKIVSPLIFAHVRAAYPGMPVSEQNCHPFAWGRYLWMHNGVVGGFAKIKRTLLGTLSDAAYNSIQSFHSDSAVSFAVFLNHLPDMTRPQPPEVLLQAMEATIATITSIQRQKGVTETSLLNYIMSDGNCMIATRFVSPETADAASLYYAEGASFQRAPGAPPPPGPPGTQGAEAGSGCEPCAAAGRNASGTSVMHEGSYELTFGERGARVAFVSSEPITASNTDWVAVPPNTALVMSREKGGFINIMRTPLSGLGSSTGGSALTGVPPSLQPTVPLNIPGGPNSMAPGVPSPALEISGPGSTALQPAGLRQYNVHGNNSVILSSSNALPLSAYLAQNVPAVQNVPPGTAGSALSRTASTAIVPAGNYAVSGGLGGLVPAQQGGASAAVTGLREVVLCLEAVSRGLNAKARAWVAGPKASPSVLSLRRATNMSDPNAIVAANGGISAATTPTLAQQHAAAAPGLSLGNNASGAGSLGLLSALLSQQHQPPLSPLGQQQHQQFAWGMQGGVQGQQGLGGSLLQRDSSYLGGLSSYDYSRATSQNDLDMATNGSFSALAPATAAAAAGDERGYGSSGGHQGGARTAALIASHLEKSQQQQQQHQGGEQQEGGLLSQQLQAAVLDSAGGQLLSPSPRDSKAHPVPSMPELSGWSQHQPGHNAHPQPYYQAAAEHHCQRLVGHTAPVLCVAIDHSRQMLHSSSADCTIRTWSLGDNQCLGVVTAGKKPVTHMHLHKQWLFSSAGRRLRVWDTSKVPLVSVHTLRIANNSGNVRCVLALPGKVFLGCQDASVKAFLVDESTWTQALAEDAGDSQAPTAPDYCTPASAGHVGQVNDLVASPSGELVISAGSDAMIRVWRASDLSPVRTLRGHRGSVLCLLMIENLLISGARDNTIRVWDMDLDMMCRRTLTGHKDDVTHLAAVTLKRRYRSVAGEEALPGLAPLGPHPASSGGGSSSLAPGSLGGRTSGGAGEGGAPGRGVPSVSSQRVLLPCSVVASASADGTVRLWSLTWNCLCVLSIPPDRPLGDMTNPWDISPRAPSYQPAAGNSGADVAGFSRPPTFSPGANNVSHHHTLNGVPPSPAAALTATGGVPASPIPSALCVALSREAVVAGFADGELRVWHVPDVHMAALQLVVNDLGLLGAPLPGLLPGMHPSYLPSHSFSQTVAGQQQQQQPGGGSSFQHAGTAAAAAGGMVANVWAPSPRGGPGSVEVHIAGGSGVPAHHNPYHSPSGGGSPGLAASPTGGSNTLALLGGAGMLPLGANGFSPARPIPSSAVRLVGTPLEGLSPSALSPAQLSPESSLVGPIGGVPLTVAAAAGIAAGHSGLTANSASSSAPANSNAHGGQAASHSPGAAPEAAAAKPVASTPVAVPIAMGPGSKAPGGTSVHASMRLNGHHAARDHGGARLASPSTASERSSIDEVHMSGVNSAARASEDAGSTVDDASSSAGSRQHGADITPSSVAGGRPVTPQSGSQTKGSRGNAKSPGLLAAGLAGASGSGGLQGKLKDLQAAHHAGFGSFMSMDVPEMLAANIAAARAVGGDVSLPSSEDTTPTARAAGAQVNQQQLPAASTQLQPGADNTTVHGNGQGVDTSLKGAEMTALREPTLGGDGQGLMSAASAAAAALAATLPEAVIELQTSDCRNRGADDESSSTTTTYAQPAAQAAESSSAAGVRKGGGLSISLTAAAAPLPAAAAGSPHTPAGPPLSPGVHPGAGDGRSLVAASPAGAWMLSPEQHMSAVAESLMRRAFTRPLMFTSAMSDMLMEQCLRDFVRIQTVSSNHRMREECVRGAKFIAKLLESLGADVKVVRPFEDKNPVVIGRLGHDPTKPTVTFYGHYDVQPAQEPDWRTNPFELNAVNEYLYGRGTSDNKGPLLAFIFAVKELLDSCRSGAAEECDEECDGEEKSDRKPPLPATSAPCYGRSARISTTGLITGAAGSGGGGPSGGLPINVAFIFEGEEENGSIGFREAVTQNLRWFEGTQLVIISNTNWVGESVPCLTYGMRGMISLSVTVSGPQRDVHSGNDGGVFVEPMVDLIQLMSTVMEPGSTRIKIPGFYDHVAPNLIDLAWSSLQQHGGGEFSREGYQAALGVPALATPPSCRSLLEARWARPSLSIVDMRPSASAASSSSSSERSACYRFGPTRFSVIPKTAVAKVSVRFVPRQDPHHIITRLRDHIHTEFAKLGSSNTVSVHVDALGNWWEADVGSRYMQMAEAAVRREWGCEPLYVREGGTMPVASVLERMLSAPAIMIPMGQSSDSPHLANERIRRVNLLKGKAVIRGLLEEVAGLWQPGAPSSDLAAAAAACRQLGTPHPLPSSQLQQIPVPANGEGCAAARLQEE